MASWGSAGPEVSWGFRDLEVGGKCDLVAEVVSLAGDSVLVVLFPGNQRAKILVTVPGDCFSMSIFDATLMEKGGTPTFLVDNPEDVLFHGRSSRDGLSNLIELCCGIGIGTKLQE